LIWHKHKAVWIVALVFLLLTLPVSYYLINRYNTPSDMLPHAAAAVFSSSEDNQSKTVKVIQGTEEQVVTTSAATVQMLLAELQIELGPQDRVEPALEENPADSVKIIRVETQRITEKQDLDYPVEKKLDAQLYKGEEKVVQKGQKGLTELVYEVVLEDGKEISRKLLEKITVKEPVAQLVAVGDRQTVSRGGQNIQFDRMLKMSATAYTHTGNKTYSGVWPSKGTVAVDPKVIPLGTRLYIDGYGYARALDVGSSIKGNRIDLFFETKEEAFKWGRRTVQVFVLK